MQTKQGAAKAKKTNLERHGNDYFERIGAIGGRKKGVAKGFAAGAAGRERARRAGSIGGARSRRGRKVIEVDKTDEIIKLWEDGIGTVAIAEVVNLNYRTVRKVVENFLAQQAY
jgi:DNA invertase Pin-like site-specific DNA recombinase